jgi:putative ABC transport system ATP-binding protein
MNLIEISDLKFSYSKSAPEVLDVPSFFLKKAEKVFLYGPSGCGKTTFLEVLAGVLVPQSGKFSILEKNVIKMTDAERDEMRAAHIGFIFQSFNLIPYLNVEENALLPIQLSSARRNKIAAGFEKEQLENICRDLGILDLLKKPVTELSVGQQQRVAVARALIGKPELILADEPTSALDQDHRKKFIRLLFEVCEKEQIAVLFVSHDRSLQDLFDRSISLPEINRAEIK